MCVLPAVQWWQMRLVSIAGPWLDHPSRNDIFTVNIFSQSLIYLQFQWNAACDLPNWQWSTRQLYCSFCYAVNCIIFHNKYAMCKVLQNGTLTLLINMGISWNQPQHIIVTVPQHLITACCCLVTFIQTLALTLQLQCRILTFWQMNMLKTSTLQIIVQTYPTLATNFFNSTRTTNFLLQFGQL